MRQNLVPIRVTIRLGQQDGKKKAIYPDFNQIPAAQRGEMDWSYFIDSYGSGWLYDSLSGLGESDTVNPDPGTQIGVIAVPEDFAIAAASLFPADVVIVGESQLRQFYDERCAAQQAEIIYDEKEMAVVEELRKQGVKDTDARIKDAIDPNKPQRGLRDNPRKTWAKFKGKFGISIHPDHAEQ